MKVKFAKLFVSGNLKGLTVDCELPMANLELATEFVAFCHKHATKPVKSCVGSDTHVYLNARIISD